MLTKQQKRAIDYIALYQGEHGGVSPTFDEIKVAIGIASKSGVHRVVTGLEERGFLRRMPNHARALEVLRLSSGEQARPYRAGANMIGGPKIEPLHAQALPVITIPTPGKPPLAVAYLCPDGKIGGRG